VNATSSALAGCFLFEGIPVSEIDGLLDKIPYTVKQYHRGAIIAFQGDQYDHLMIILSGEADAHIQSGNGKTIRIESLKSPDPIASGILFADNNYLPVTVTAVTDVSLIVFRRETVLFLCRQYREFLFAYMRDMGDKIVFLADKIRHLTFNTIRQKTAAFLLDQRIRQRLDSITLPYTKEVIAELFGVTRPALSRVFGDFVEEGVIKQEGRLVHIIQPEKLKETLAENGE